MNILLLGNGFDLYHGLPTKYVNFLNTVSYLANSSQKDIKTVGDVFGKTELHKNDRGIASSYQKYKATYDKVPLDNKAIQKIVEIGKKNIWFSFLLKSFNKDIGWIDFEQEIAIVVRSFEELLRDARTTIAPNKRLSSPEARYLVRVFNFYIASNYSGGSSSAFSVNDDYCIEYPLGSKNKIINKEKIVDTLIVALSELAEGLKLYLQCFVDNVVMVLKANGEIELCKALLHTNYTITFNYTNTYEILYSNNQTFHLHGNVNDKIILGINPDSADDIETIDTSFIAFKKYYQRVLYETDVEYLHWLTDNRETVEDRNLLIMGHSLDVTDKDILYELIECATDITILYHDEASKAQYISNLVKIFGREGFIQLRAMKNLTLLPLNMDFTNFAMKRAEQQAYREFCEEYDREEIVIV